MSMSGPLATAVGNVFDAAKAAVLAKEDIEIIRSKPRSDILEVMRAAIQDALGAESLASVSIPYEPSGRFVE